jgi:hypothetical protein
MIMKKRFALMVVVCMAFMSRPTFAQVKGLNQQEMESNVPLAVAPDGRDFQLSPDGKLLAFFSLYKEVPNVFTVPVNGGEFKQVSFVGEPGVQEFYWLKNNMVAFVTAPGSAGKSSLFVGDFAAGEYRRISPEGAHVRVISVSGSDGGLNYEMNSEQNPFRFDYYQFSTESMSSKRLASNGDEGFQWASDFGMGLAFSYASLNGALHLFAQDGSKLISLEKCMQFKPLAPSAIHKGHYYCISDNERNGAALVEINLMDGKEREVLFAKPGSSVERVFITPRGRRPIMCWYRGKENGFELLDKTYSAMMNDVKSKVKGIESLQVVNCSYDENVWILLNEYADGRKVYYRYNVANKDVRQLNTVDMTHEIKSAKVVMHSVTDTRGNEMVLRFYSPPVEEIKNPTVLVFGEGMWSLNSQAHDSLMMMLGLNGFPVLEVDLLHSKSYGATAMLNGFEWWSNMLISDIPAMIKAINELFPTTPGVVPMGIGIGAEIAMRAMNLYPDMKVRSILLQPYFSANEYADVLNKRKSADLRYMVKGNDEQKAKQMDNLNAAANPMIIYSALDPEYVATMDTAIQSMVLTGNSPVIMNYSDEYGIFTSGATRAQATMEITSYIGAVPVRKIK